MESLLGGKLFEAEGKRYTSVSAFVLSHDGHERLCLRTRTDTNIDCLLDLTDNIVI
jgi:hypothetical protein